jgi:hypothetical protein
VVFLEEILDSTIKILYDLHKLYKNDKLSYDSFNKHTALKIKFIRDNLHKITSYEKRNFAVQILEKCENIILRQPNQHFYNIQL